MERKSVKKSLLYESHTEKANIAAFPLDTPSREQIEKNLPFYHIVYYSNATAWLLQRKVKHTHIQTQILNPRAATKALYCVAVMQAVGLEGGRGGVNSMCSVQHNRDNLRS